MPAGEGLLHFSVKRAWYKLYFVKPFYLLKSKQVNGKHMKHIDQKHGELVDIHDGGDESQIRD